MRKDRSERMIDGPQAPADSDPRLLDLYRHWTTLRPAPDLLPGRQHFDPVAVPALLKWIWLLDISRDPLRFRYRLLGTEQVAFMMADHTGRWIDDVFPRFNTVPQFAQFKLATEQGLLAYYEGPPTSHMDNTYIWMERLLLPLARDGKTVDMLLAISVYERTFPRGAGP